MNKEEIQLRLNIEKAYVNLINALTEERDYYKKKCDEIERTNKSS